MLSPCVLFLTQRNTAVDRGPGTSAGGRREAACQGGMFVGMKIKTSVTIDERLLRAIDKATRPGWSRSRVIEDATRDYLARRARSAREERDLGILNAAADDLNRE